MSLTFGCTDGIVPRDDSVTVPDVGGDIGDVAATDSLPGDAASDSADAIENDSLPDNATGDVADAAVVKWPTCGLTAGANVLAGKATYFDQVAVERHLAGDGLLRNLYLNEDLETVQKWFHVENVILWSGMYLASQAFRYKVTGDQAAQDNAKVVTAALHELTNVTGVSGLYGRSMYKPGVSYNIVPADSPSWTDSTAPGYEGWRFRNDVSKDGYAGLMFGYAAAMEHFDDPVLLNDIRARLREIIDHIVGNHLQIIDTNGLVTEHGRLYHTAFDDFPGFNAMLSSSWIKIAATELVDTNLDDLYYGCLMRQREGVDCSYMAEVNAFEPEYISYIESMEQQLNLFMPDCKQNYDNFDMCYQAIYPLMQRETDPVLRERLLGVVRNNMFNSDDPAHQDIGPIGNSLFTFIYAAIMGDGPDNDILQDAVDRAICTMKDFPAQKFERGIPAGTQEGVCTTRLNRPSVAEVIPLAEYPFDNYLWRLDFFELTDHDITEDLRNIYSPEDYLVAYWLGRMHGLITADM